MISPRMGIRRAARLLLDTVLPRLCPGCEGELPGHLWICLGCRRRFRTIPPRWICFFCRSLGQGRRDREAGMMCSETGHRRWWGRSRFWMEPPLDGVVHEMKYSGRPDLARPLGKLLGSLVVPGPMFLTAVPLHAVRHRERGFNQASGLAEALGDRWGVPHVDRLLLRVRSTSAQARLPEEKRGENVRNAFRARRPSWVEGRTLCLVDDVATTGTTLVEASRALYRAGAQRVIPVTLALA